MPKQKPHYKRLPVLVTDAAEIESIRRDNYGDLVGVIDSKGDAYAEVEALAAYREQQPKSSEVQS